MKLTAPMAGGNYELSILGVTGGTGPLMDGQFLQFQGSTGAMAGTGDTLFRLQGSVSDVSSVPEPTSILLLGTGLGGLALAAWRSKK